MSRSNVSLQPLYLQVKRHILDNIGSGKWGTSARVPSENDIVKSFGVSRMTANRALRELRDEGVLVRVAGVGSFVADQHAHAHPLEIRSIADEIRRRGHVHRAEIVSLERTRAAAELAEDFGIAPRSELYCSVIVHFENDRPIQLEDRYVLPKLAPDYMTVDFNQTTPYDYLIKVAPLQEAEHLLRAVMPEERTRKLLDMKHDEPCLLMIRRTWTAGQIASVARLYYPVPDMNCRGVSAPEDATMLAPLKPRVIRAARGNTLSARTWMTEAPLRMLMNNLDPEVAENPAELVVYGGIGRAARDWNCYDRIVETLKTLTEEETLLVQSGKPVGVFPTHADAPRVLIANSNLVPHWATWEHFNELDRKGLAMYGQMTAGSWIYIGSQGIVQGTYETFAEMGRRHFDGKVGGKWIFTAGLGGMGGAQPLAATMAGFSMLAVECRQSRIAKRLETGYVDAQAHSLDEALAMLEAARKNAKPLSVALLGNVVDVLHTLLERGIRPDALTDQTSAHDPVNGYLPQGWTVEQWDERRAADPTATAAAATRSMARHVEYMLRFKRLGLPVFDYGNNIRQVAFDAGVADAFDFPGFVPEYIRPLFCRGVGPFRWVALSGDPEDIYKTDAKVKELIPDDPHLHHWLDMARSQIHFQGLPARICWVGLGQRHRLGLAFNEMVRSGELSAPIVIGRDHLDSGSVASPNRETEAMKDGSDAVSDWPLLNALLNTASGATWVSIHHGGGVGMGYSQHAGVVIVCDGSEAAAKRIRRVLWNDPGTGVMRHADAGYDIAIACAREQGLNLPMIEHR